MKKLIKKTEKIFNAVEVFKVKCSCDVCACACSQTSTSASETTKNNTSSEVTYKGMHKYPFVL